MNSNTDSYQKVAAITGAGRGNGRATAFELGKQGFSLFLSDIKADLLEETIGDLNSSGFKVSGGVYDASNLQDSDRFIKDIQEHYGNLDVFVNNAGASRPQSFPEVTEDMWDWTIDLNLKGPYFLMQQAAKIMTRQRSGSIINIASISAWGGKTSSPPYAIAKAGIVTMTVTAAVLLGQYGVRVNAIAPGIVNTHFHDEVDLLVGQQELGLQPGQLMQRAENDIPLGRLAESDDIASAVSFLASDASRYITGETITVGGGKSRL